MDKENILAINIPNAISILIMATVGGLLLTAIRKAVKQKLGSGNPFTSGQSPAVVGSQGAA